MTFLADIELRPVSLAGLGGCPSVGLALGKGPQPLEIAVAEASGRPTLTKVRDAWRVRLDRRCPLLVMVLCDGRAALYGPAGDQPPGFSALGPSWSWAGKGAG